MKFKKNSFRILLVLFIVSVSCVFPIDTRAQLIDLDLDGLQDIIVTEVNNSDTFEWRFYSSSSGFATKAAVTTEGASGHTPVLGKWDSSGSLTPSTVKLRSDSNYRWNVLGSASDLGKRRDKIFIGFDVDGNAVTDFAIGKRSGRVTIYQNHFSGSGTTTELTFPRKIVRNGHPVALVNLGTPILGFSKSKRRNRYEVVMQDTLGNSITGNLGRIGGTILSLHGIATTGTIPDAILVVIRKGRGFRFLVKDMSGNTIANESFRGNVRKVAVANYAANTGSEILYTTKNGVFIVNLFDSSFATMDLSETISERIIPPVSVFSQRSSSAGGNSNSGSGIGSVCSSTSSLSTGVLWKPDSDVSDNRGGKPVVLFQGSKKPGTGSINIYAINGTQIGVFTFKAPNHAGINGNADHYYSGWVGGSSETGGQLAAEATAAAGSSNVYFSGRGGICYGPIHPDGRSGGIF